MAVKKPLTQNRIGPIAVKSFGNYKDIILGALIARVYLCKIVFVCPPTWKIAPEQEHLLDTMRDVIANNLDVDCVHNRWIDAANKIVPIAELIQFEC